MKNIGILGGLGPEATQLLFKKIIEKTPARNDQEHIPIIIHNNTQIPDRTKAILYKGEDPTPQLLKSIRILERSDADFIVIPCNTAHFFIEELQRNTKIPIINMIKETAEFIKKNYPEVKKIGLLATTGTIESKIYHLEFANYGIEIISPNKNIQENIVMGSIYSKEGIKAGYHIKPKKRLEETGKKLIEKGADLIIAGCTEISIVLNQENVSYVVIDPLTLLAEKAIENALLDKSQIEMNFNQIECLTKEAVLEATEEEEE